MDRSLNHEIIFIDFETFFDTADNYTLQKQKGKPQLSVYEYINDPRFMVFGLGISRAGVRSWISGHDAVKHWVRGIDWSVTSVCAHNTRFDAAILRWIYGVNPESYIDTLAISRAVIGNQAKAHSLAACAVYLGLFEKGHLATDGIRDLTPSQEKELAEYCLHDVYLCEEIYKALVPQFPIAELSVVDWTIRCFVEPVLVLDSPKLEELHNAEKVRRETIFTDIGIEKAVFASNKRFPDLLESRGFVVPVKPSPKVRSADGSPASIPALALGDVGFLELCETENEELKQLCEARIAAKSTLLETRSLKFLAVSKLGSFPFDLNYSGAVNTHRFSGGSGAGGNPQNLTKGSALRGAISAPQGHALLVADFAGIELRIVAWLAREGALISTLSTLTGDPYAEFASQLYCRRITKADKAERSFGKEAVLGLGYGMGAKKFASRVRIKLGKTIDHEEARKVVNLYRSYYGRVPTLWPTLDGVIPYIAKHARLSIPGIPFLQIRGGCVYLPSGLQLRYPNLHRNQDGEWEYMAKGVKAHLYGGKLLENIAQALAGEICKLAIRRATVGGVQCVGQVHDEILAVVPDTQVKQGLAVLQSAMEAPIPWWPQIKLFAEVGAGTNWLEAKH